MGFVLLRDTRAEDVGYDFLCKQGERIAHVEVKTFTLDGRIIVSANELRAALRIRGDYYMIGFIDDGPEQQWVPRIVIDPLPRLPDKGKFDLDVKLQARAGEIFNLVNQP